MIKGSFVLSRENIDVSQSFFQYLVNYIEENVDLHVYGQENISFNSMTPTLPRLLILHSQGVILQF